ncbi:MAG: hypothetical protein H8D84_00470 [Proteobacteria bacterium]|nr:hypothetical protein [Pseudomonadota bacterium]
MPEIKNAFIKGKMNKDLDERLIPNGEYRDALNIDVDYSKSSDVGALANVVGNVERTSITHSSGTVCIGNIKDTENDKIYWFTTHSSKDVIGEYNLSNNTYDTVLCDTGSILNFNADNLITGVNVLDGILYFTDNLNEPRQVDIEYWKGQTATNASATSTGLTADRITVIKKAPMEAPTLNMSSSLRDGAGTVGGSDVTVTINLGATTGAGLVDAKDSGVDITGTFSADPNYNANDIIVLKFEYTASDTGDITKTEARVRLASNYDGGVDFTAEILTISELVRGAAVAYTALLQEDDPLFELKFPRFSYRYKYNNGQYSSLAPFSNAAFLPDSTVGNNIGFEYNAEDGYNLAMVNTLRSLTLEYLDSNLSADVDEIDIIYKDSVSSNVYIVDTIKRQSDNSIASTFEVKDEQIFKVLPSNQLLRLYDSVPKKAKAQDITANRLIYGNYTHQFDLPVTPVTFDIKVKNRYIASTSDAVRKQRQSIKSNRSYQFGVVYMDTYGRQTPVLTDKTGVIKVPQSEAKNMTKFTAKITSSAPSFATNYRYFIKEISSTTYNLCADSFYQDDQGYMYVSFPTSEINKVKVDDILILKKKTGSEVSEIEDKFKVLDKLTSPPQFLARPMKENYRPEEFVFGTDFGVESDLTTIKPGSTPVPNRNRVTIRTMHNVGETKVKSVVAFAAGEDGVSRKAYDAVSPGQFVRFVAGDAESKAYEVKSKEIHWDDNDDIQVHFKEEFGNDVTILYEDYADNPTTTALKGGAVMVGVDEKDESGKAEFEGRFFLKIKADTNLITQLAGTTNVENLDAISTVSMNGTETSSDPGFMMRFGGKASTNSASWGIDQDASAGGWDGWGESSPGGYSTFPSSVISAGYHFAFETDLDWNETDIDYPSHPFLTNLKVDNFIQFDGTSDTNYYKIKAIHKQEQGGGPMVFAIQLDTNLAQNLTYFSGGSASDTFQMTIFEVGKDDLVNITNPPIFEVEPQDDVDIDLYYETQEDLTTSSNHGNENSLLYYNCISFENGVESFVIRDDYNAPALGKGVRVSSIFEENYQEENLKTGLIFSQIYNNKTGLNRLNQFIIAEPITKELNPEYGSIQLLHTRYNDIIAYCEDKVLKILTKKDALFNADGNSNVTSNTAVLGQSIPYNSNYGIGKNPESFASFTYRGYFVDKKNGVVVRHSADGMEAISVYGMKDYFRDSLAAQSGYMHGSYNVKKEQYNISLPSTASTLSFSEPINGWVSRKSFVQEGGLSMNNRYFTFKGGKLYEHEVGAYNSFYGTVTTPSVTFIFNEAPANMKNFRTLNYEGSSGWTCSNIKTGDTLSGDEQAQTGSVSAFVEKERKYFNYIKGIKETQTNIDYKALNVQGIGTWASIDHDSGEETMEYGFGVGEVPADLQVGDDVYYVAPSATTGTKIGPCESIDADHTIVVDYSGGSAPPTSPSYFVFYAKNAEWETSGLLGYYAEVTMQNTATASKELYSVGSEISISS